MRPFELIEKAKELFTIQRDANGNLLGLLYPTDDCGVGSYGRPALAVDTSYYTRDTIGYHLTLCIQSIDDSGVTVFWPAMTLEKVMQKINMCHLMLTNQGFKCPSQAFLNEFCRDTGSYAQYW